MKEITVQELRNAAGQRPLIDVREVDEFAAGHVPGATNIPLSQLAERLHELPAEPFDIICQGGVRSARACEALEPMGHEVTNVQGGTGAWISAGYEIER